jgi:hypothetical protein
MLQRTSKFSVLAAPLPAVNIDALVMEKKEVFDSILDPSLYYDSSQLSKNDRKEPSKRADMTLTYGEIDFSSFADIIYKVKYEYKGLSGGELFCDVGSGSGKAVFAAALLHNFQRCVGVEILLSLDAFAKECQLKWTGSVANCHGTDIEFFGGSFLDTSLLDWRDADFLFANSTCYSDDMMIAISELAGMHLCWYVVGLLVRVALLLCCLLADHVQEE